MKTVYIPSLDGLRALSIILVLFSHFGLQSVVPGVFGVTVFFFVSGYLITGQLVQELDKDGALDLPGFYIRRALRLYPALLAMVTLATVGLALIGDGSVTQGDLLAAVAYGANFWEQAGGFQAGTPNGWHPFDILWSLAVEEHYYLVFPLLTLLVGRRRGLFALVTALLIVAIGLWRIELVSLCSHSALGCHEFRIEHGTDTRVDSILFGALLAILLHSRWRDAALRVVRCRPVWVAGAVLLLVSLALRSPWLRDTLRFDLQGLGLFACVGALLFDARLQQVRTLLSLKPMRVLGRWSYSLYLWHWVVLAFAGALLPQLWLAPLQRLALPPLWWAATVLPLLIAVSLICAACSYYGVERPMVRLRRRFGAAAVADAPRAGQSLPSDPVSRDVPPSADGSSADGTSADRSSADRLTRAPAT